MISLSLALVGPLFNYYLPLFSAARPCGSVFYDLLSLASNSRNL